MKLFSAGISTETNTFSPMPTGLADFRVVRAADVPDDGIIGGFAAATDLFRQRTTERGWDFVFGLYASASPAGTTTRSTYESLRDEMLVALRAAMPVDIVLLPLHGAMVAEGYDDCETDMITRVREIVGPDARIGAVLDLHCNVTQEMIECADAIVIYKEYPHIDVADRAEDLFQIIAAAAEGRTNPVMASYDCRMIGLFRTPFEPMRSFVDDMLDMEGKGGVLSVSLAHGFPWGDVPISGAQALAVTDGDTAKAEQVAAELGQRFFSLRHQLYLPVLSLDEALDQALSVGDGPVVIADQSDNTGGGAPGDSTFVLRALLERGIENAGVAMIWDPVVVQVAMAAGKGATLDLRLGGKMGPTSGDPLDLTTTVTGIAENMSQDWPQQGKALNLLCGDAVALHTNGVDIIVNSLRKQVFSPQVFSNLGIDPTRKRLLVVKSLQHFYAAFSPIASEIIYMAAPGAIAPRFKEIPYKRASLNMYPRVDDPFAVEVLP